MKQMTIIGAGLLIGTALAVIIPEGVNTLYSSQKCMEQNHHEHKRFADNNLAIFKEQLSYNVNINKPIRFVRNLINKEEPSKDHKQEANEQLKIKEMSQNSAISHENLHNHSNNSHSLVGLTLVLGFVFMLIVDQIGGKISHKTHQVLDNQAMRNKISFTTTLGLVVHAAADGIALGAAAASSKTDVEMIVFIAIMLHKVIFIFELSRLSFCQFRLQLR